MNTRLLCIVMSLAFAPNRFWRVRHEPDTVRARDFAAARGCDATNFTSVDRCRSRADRDRDAGSRSAPS